MKNKYLYTLILIILTGLSTSNAQNKNYNTLETLSMEAGYANDIFYSINEGEILNIPRAGWDIAFYTSAFSAGIIINEGSGDQLYTYPNGDTSDWTTVDTSGISSWTILYNSPEYWEDGAFNRNSKAHPDYGWGIYNMVTHTVVGDSIYVIKTENGFKKLWIVEKISVNNVYKIRYADIDGSNEQTVEIDVKPFVEKNFVYFSLTTNEILDREPSDEWDVLFTKYIDITYDEFGDPHEYLVTGATSNINRYANKFYPVPDEYVNYSSKPFDSLKNVIGYDWKSFDFGSMSWKVEDSTVFFVQNKLGDVHRLRFTLWEGSSSGYFEFYNDLVEVSGIENEFGEQHTISVYPNPAVDFVNINISNENLTNGEITISDLSGRIVYNSILSNSSGKRNVRVFTNDFVKGIYFITVIGDDVKETKKLIIR